MKQRVFKYVYNLHWYSKMYKAFLVFEFVGMPVEITKISENKFKIEILTLIVDGEFRWRIEVLNGVPDLGATWLQEESKISIP